jgi:hypothetical protein
MCRHRFLPWLLNLPVIRLEKREICLHWVLYLILGRHCQWISQQFWSGCMACPNSWSKIKVNALIHHFESWILLESWDTEIRNRDWCEVNYSGHGMIKKQHNKLTTLFYFYSLLQNTCYRSNKTFALLAYNQLDRWILTYRSMFQSKSNTQRESSRLQSSFLYQYMPDFVHKLTDICNWSVSISEMLC